VIEFEKEMSMKERKGKTNNKTKNSTQHFKTNGLASQVAQNLINKTERLGNNADDADGHTVPLARGFVSLYGRSFGLLCNPFRLNYL
jgi:hypothetical protein